MDPSYEALEVGLATAAGAIAIFPTIATYIAWKRTGSRRMLFAMLAFMTFLLKSVTLVFILLIDWKNDAHELVEFGGDVMIIIFFMWALVTSSGVDNSQFDFSLGSSESGADQSPEEE